MENKIQRKRGRPAKPPLKIDVEGTIFESPISMEELEQAMEPTPIERPSMRAEMREESPAERAKRRAAEIRGHLGGIDEGTDEFYIDPSMVPDGWAYEWKRRLLLGAEDPSHNVALHRMGWEAVPVSRHPEMMPRGWAGETIERKGMILMERPLELVEEARRNDLRKAHNQVRDKEAQLAGTPEGTLTRDHAQARPNIKKGYEPIPIPKD
jgi:hypothetical protein